jgi:hypothetical protein
MEPECEWEFVHRLSLATFCRLLTALSADRFLANLLFRQLANSLFCPAEKLFDARCPCG